MRPSHVRLALLLGLLAASARAEEAASEWDPTRTVAFVVGVLSFQDQKLATWPEEGRRDAELVELLRRRGAKEVVFLKDREATGARIARDFSALLERTQAGQTLLVYYAGHGYRKDDGAVGFVPWDQAGDWQVASILDAIEARFKGQRALLLADCCHSGGLADAAEARQARSKLAWASLTSAWSTSRSTGNWTFTESLLAALGGEPRADPDGDGAVTLGEAAALAEAEMAFGEEQLTRFYASPGFGPALRLARAAGPRPGPRVGERLEVQAEGEWWKARVLEVQGERLKVRFYGWDASYDEWVEPARTRPWKTPARQVGQKVEVESEGKWYPATIVDTRLGLAKVTYQGWDASWDEWVPSGRMREPGQEAKKKRRRGKR